MTLSDKIKLIDELIKQDRDSTVADFRSARQEHDEEIAGIKSAGRNAKVGDGWFAYDQTDRLRYVEVKKGAA